MHRTHRFLCITILACIALSSTGCASLVIAPIKAARELTGLAFDIAEGTTKLSIQSTKGSIELAGAGVDLAGKMIKVANAAKQAPKVQLAQK
jgi:hypothetical protein